MLASYLFCYVFFSTGHGALPPQQRGLDQAIQAWVFFSCLFLQPASAGLPVLEGFLVKEG